MAPKRRPSALRAVLTRQRARAARGCAGMPRAAGRTAPTPGNELELELELDPGPSEAPLAPELVQWNGSPRLRSRPIRIASSPSTAHQYAIARSPSPYPRLVLRLMSSNGCRCPRLKPLFWALWAVIPCL